MNVDLKIKWKWFSLLSSLLLFFLFLVLLFSASSSRNPVSSAFQRGMSYATYAEMDPEVYGSLRSNMSLERMQSIGVEWVAINVVYYQYDETSSEIYPLKDRSPTRDSVAKAVEKARSLGMKVMLKPMVDLETCTVKPCWRGNIKPSEDWFRSYASFINSWAEFAEKHNVEILCIGCEYTNTVEHAERWISIITGVRERYHGELTYAATWDECQRITWWDKLDYIGVNAYFPLTDKRDPTVEELTIAWKPWVEKLKNLSTKYQKPILFTEIGYLSCDGTNIQPWNYTMQRDKNIPLDLQEQADCYQAALKSIWNKPWFRGFYWWYWQPDPEAGGPENRDYTPQNKPAEKVLKEWYRRK